jgi:serine/threonine protein kinase
MFSKSLLVPKANYWPNSLKQNSHTKPLQPAYRTRRVRQDNKWRTLATFESRDEFPDDDNDNDQFVDINALAARLAAEAARLQNEANQIVQSSGDEDDRTNPLDDAFSFSISRDSIDPNGRPASASKNQNNDDDFVSPFGLETKAQEAGVLSEIGDGGFSASEFELLSELGQISIQQVEAPVDDSPFPSTTGQRTARAAVIAYTASYFSGMPFQDPVVTLMKEYLPGARAVACNELQILKHLCGMPDIDGKWRAASSPLSSKPPVVELLGYFLAGPSERAVLADPSIRLSPAADTIWIVQKWEGMAPLTMYPSTQQTSGFGLGKLFGGNSAAQRDRTKMLKAIIAGALHAVGYVHDRGVIHGAIGSGSLLISTFNDSDWLRAVVKIDNFGFARRIIVPRLLRGGSSSIDTQSSLYPGPIPIPVDADDSPLSLGQKADRRQLAVVLFECILGALSNSGPSDFTSAESVQRILGEVFNWDFDRYRQYIEDEEQWEAVVALLSADDDAGWQLLKQLAVGNIGASALLAETIFCEI